VSGIRPLSTAHVLDLKILVDWRLITVLLASYKVVLVLSGEALSGLLLIGKG
jgi:hypothetical protein